jgi:hypothetical protein
MVPVPWPWSSLGATVEVTRIDEALINSSGLTLHSSFSNSTG